MQGSARFNSHDFSGRKLARPSSLLSFSSGNLSIDLPTSILVEITNHKLGWAVARSSSLLGDLSKTLRVICRFPGQIPECGSLPPRFEKYPGVSTKGSELRMPRLRRSMLLISSSVKSYKEDVRFQL